MRYKNIVKKWSSPRNILVRLAACVPSLCGNCHFCVKKGPRSYGMEWIYRLLGIGL